MKISFLAFWPCRAPKNFRISGRLSVSLHLLVMLSSIGLRGDLVEGCRAPGIDYLAEPSGKAVLASFSARYRAEPSR